MKEREALRKILQVIERVKGGEEPDELSIVATEILAGVDLENASDELVDLLHDCFDYSNTPTEYVLKEIEEKARRLSDES